MDTTSFDLLLEEFESALHQGERPEISRYLERAAESQRSQLLRELIRVDLCCRRDESPAPGEMEYQALFPDEHAIVAEAFRLFRQQPERMRRAIRRPYGQTTPPTGKLIDNQQSLAANGASFHSQQPRPQMVASRMCRGWSRKDMVTAGNRPVSRAGG